MRLQELEIDESEKEAYISRIHAFLSECACGSTLVIKQPDITEVMDFWFEAARRAGFSTKLVIPIRHPKEVFESIAAALGNLNGKAVSVELVNAFWVKRNLLSERQSRNVPRVFVEFSNLMKNWRAEIVRLSEALSVELRPDHAAIEEFLTADLYRQRFSGPVTETLGYSWTTRVYAILSAAAQDGPIDFPSLDEIYHAYRANERTFRIASDDFRTISSLVYTQEFRDSLK
jgi:hypothetical protein